MCYILNLLQHISSTNLNYGKVFIKMKNLYEKCFRNRKTMLDTRIRTFELQ